MADTMQFDLVSPERSLASLLVTSVQIPGADGDMTAMPDHAPLITTLRPGILRVEAGGETTDYVVTGGFAEINGTAISVLAEKVVLASEMTSAMANEMVAGARSAYDAAKDAQSDQLDIATKLLADMEAMEANIDA